MDIELTPEQLMAQPAVRSLITEAAQSAVEAFRNAAPPAPEAIPGGTGAAGAMVNRQRPQKLSIGRAFLAARSGNWKGAELENDFSQVTRSLYPNLKDETETGQFSWPANPQAYLDVLTEGAFRNTDSEFQKHASTAYRAMSEGTPTTSATGGGVLDPILFLQDEFVYALVSATTVEHIPGVQQIPITQSVVSLPRESAAATASTVAEAGSLTAADPTFAQQTITARKIYGLRRYSNELLSDANPALNAYLANDLARDVSLQKDKQFLTGDGTGANLTGIQNVSSLTTVSTLPATNGQNPSYDALVEMIWALRRANAEPNAWVMHPALGQALAQLKDANGRPLFLDGNLFQLGGANMPIAGMGTPFGPSGATPSVARGTILNIPVYFSTQLSITETQGTSSNCTHAFLGDFRYCKILQRQAVDVAVSPHIYFTTDETASRAIWRGAIALTQPAAFEAVGGFIVS